MKTASPWRRLVAEFLVISTGVALGLLADDWRVGRDDRVRERVVLSEISADLRQDSVELSRLAQRAQSWNEAGLWVARNQGLPVYEDSAVASIQSLLVITIRRPQRAAYVGLRDAGELDIIRSTEVRRAVVEYFEADQQLIDALATAAHALFVDAQNALYRYMEVHVTNEATSLSGARFNWRESWESASLDPALIGPLLQLGMVGATLNRNISGALAANATLQGAISDYLR